MAVDVDEQIIRNAQKEVLFDMLSHPNSSNEERLIRKELERRGVLAPFNPYDLSRELIGIKKPIHCSTFANPLLDPISFMLCVDPAKDDTELHINVKRRNIKFNFNN